MSYSSQRYDLDAAAARKRSQSFSRDRGHGYYSRHSNNRAHGDYYRAPTVSRKPSYGKSDGRPYEKRDERSRSQRGVRSREGDRSYADHERRHSSSNREVTSIKEDRRHEGANERSPSSRDVPPQRGSHSDPGRERPHSEEASRGSSSRRGDRDDPKSSARSRREDTSHQDGKFSHLTPAEINTFRNSGRASQPTWGASTYGTYVLPLESKGRHRTMDPTKCTCKCCPHPVGIAHNHNHHRDQDSRMSSKRTGTASERNKRTSEGRYLIQVIDQSRSTLNRENGPTYPISLNPHASCDRIASFLAPEKRYAKVIVHWDNGSVQKLDNQIAMEDLIRHAEFLEVREIKSVHWAA